MNKRQAKKAKKKILMWARFDSVPNRCRYCAFYESGDDSVGLPDGCCADYLYDKNGDFIEEKNDVAIAYLNDAGWTCPYYRKQKEMRFNAPYAYKEIKAFVQKEEEYEKHLSSVLM